MIDWRKIRYFTSCEFPEDPDRYADPDLIYKLDKFRNFVNQRIFPSPVNGALARFGGSVTSQHYVGAKEKPVRYSKAVDVFIEGNPVGNFIRALQFGWTGIGLYIDTIGLNGKPWPMLHLDQRSEHLIWFAKKINNKTEYIYPANNYHYYECLKNINLYKVYKY